MPKDTCRDDYMVCDQCRIRKIRCSRDKPMCTNCERLGLQCEWSGQGKKCNQTTLLNHTILGMGSRLQHLENSVAETRMSLKRLFEASSIALPPPTMHSGSSSRPTPNLSPRELSQRISPQQLSPQHFSSSAQKPIYSRPPWRFLSGHENERCFGPTSLESIMLNIKDAMFEIPGVESNAIEECVLQAQQKIDLLVSQGEDKYTGEISLPTEPPFAILDAMIETYFGSMNQYFPIWTKNRFRQMATRLRESSSSERDLASIICCNNLILIAMSAESLCAHQRDHYQSKGARRTSSIDTDIIAGFLANAKRAIRNVDQLVSPRLLNVQALLSLHIVAHEHLSIGQSETLFVLAARCAKSIGVNQWHCSGGQFGEDDVEQRHNISKCLYILDKEICWTVGTSPSISLSEVHFGPSLASAESRMTVFQAAKAEMAKIEETIYLATYAPHVKPRTEDQVREFAALTLSRIQNCLTDSGVDPDKIQKESESSALDLQLLIRSLCVQLLLTWPHKGHPDLIFQRDQEVAKMCMKLLLRLWNLQPDQANHAVFPLFLASLPPTYLYEVLSTVISGKDSGSNMELLQSFVDMLQTISDCRAEASYNRRLYQLSIVVIDMVNARKNRHKRHKSASSGPKNIHLVSELQSFPTNGFMYFNPQVAELDNSALDTAIFEDQDHVSTSKSPVTPQPDYVSRDAEDYLPQLWNYASTSSGIDNSHSLAMDALGGESFRIFSSAQPNPRYI